MRIHHLGCGSFCPNGARLIEGEGGWFEQAHTICHCLLLETNEGLVLVDTGFGMDDARDPGQLGLVFRALMRPQPSAAEAALTQIAALGFAATDVRHIVATHLDLDHAGGLPDFPDAEVHVFAPELQAALHPSLRDRSRYIGGAHWRHEPRWVTHEACGDEWLGFESVRILPGIDAEVLLVPLLGHSRGHTAVAVRTDDSWLLHCGDAYFHHDELANPPSCPPMLAFFQSLVAADNAARKANQERLRELAARHGEKVTLFCGHDRHELEREQRRSAAGAAAAGG